ncbi:MAG TPA: YbhB/YbcL family Raf kinase inhibitor-like protein [Candidatus Acidoferrales bacterium]|nr:YbhB/YbcL family Raf kinase inhibitor-like protein [Candidatus Acidoferrales bacterium]
MPFRLTSNAFKNGQYIPAEFTAYGENLSPELSWTGHPVKTASFALVLEDRDAKDKRIHWVLWNIPATAHSLAQGISSIPVLPDGTHQGRSDFNTVGYAAPRLAKVAEHNYVFTLYALDSILNLKAGSSYEELKTLMGGHADPGGDATHWAFQTTERRSETSGS